MVLVPTDLPLEAPVSSSLTNRLLNLNHRLLYKHISVHLLSLNGVSLTETNDLGAESAEQNQPARICRLIFALQCPQGKSTIANGKVRIKIGPWETNASSIDIENTYVELPYIKNI